ncbi:MAG: hypothetical protein B7Z35_09310 [Hydrogenophilales bacterium 12-61-10]|nr:MAG: hypothetical protein B7Z35_09310 [Hydrogenophilales bacterium 12-61-10]
MTDRNYRLVLGLAILLILYFDLTRAMYGLIGLLFVEGITNWRIPQLVGKWTHQTDAPPIEPFDFKWPLNEERAWRLVVGALLLLTAVLFNEIAWFLPWFMGFAILGAGVSGVCPVLLGLPSLTKHRFQYTVDCLRALPGLFFGAWCLPVC